MISIFVFRKVADLHRFPHMLALFTLRLMLANIRCRLSADSLTDLNPSIPRDAALSNVKYYSASNMLCVIRMVQQKRHRTHGKFRECSSLRTLCECSRQHSDGHSGAMPAAITVLADLGLYTDGVALGV